jgi:HemY protein
MRRLIVFLLFLIGSVFVGIQLVKHQGYVLVVLEPWLLQMPIWFAFIGGIIFLMLFYLVINSIDYLKFIFYRLKNWFRFRQVSRSYNKTQHGLSLLIEGNWKKAERLLIAGVNQSVDPLLNYLGAAKAAHEQSAYEKRDQYIQDAYRLVPDAALAIGLTQADLEFKQKHYEHALATLNHLRESKPYQPRVLKLLEKVYVHLGDWQHLLDLLPSLKKAKLIKPDQKLQFEKNLYVQLFNSNTAKSREDVRQLWNRAPRDVRKNPDAICAYVKQLIRFNIGSVYDTETFKEVESLIRQSLKTEWHPLLVEIYGNMPFTEVNRQFVIAGAWLKIHGDQQILLYVLGRWCMQAKLWGKAKDYFEKCLSLGAYPKASLEYGRLLELLGESDAALRQYRDGLVGVVL